MTEKSYPWGGTTVGDAIYAKYSDGVWGEIWRKLFTSDRTTQGVVNGVLNSLQVTGVGSPISVNTGYALVDGKFYKNDASTNVVIPTPVGATRKDLIVLRKSWAGKTVRITRVAGVEGGVVAVPVQTDGVTWDIPLAEASITVGGVITISDRRTYLPGGQSNDSSLCTGRLTLTSGVPVTTSDVTGSTLYFTPYNGNLISLYASTFWKSFPLTQLSLNIVALTSNTLYDVFVYDNAGTLTLEAVAWNAPSGAAVTTITNASPRVVNTGNTTGLVAGNFVTIAGNSVAGNNANWRVGTVVVNTSFQLLNYDGTNSSVPGGVGNNGTWSQLYDSAMTRATTLVLKDGVYVKSGSLGYRYLGTILIDSSGGSTRLGRPAICVWNYYNRIKMSAYKGVASTWAGGAAAWKCYQDDYQYAIPFIVGVNDEEQNFVLKILHFATDADTGEMDVQLDLLGTLSSITGCNWESGTGNDSWGYRTLMYHTGVTEGVHVAFPAVGLSNAFKSHRQMYCTVIEGV